MPMMIAAWDVSICVKISADEDGSKISTSDIALCTKNQNLPSYSLVYNSSLGLHKEITHTATTNCVKLKYKKSVKYEYALASCLCLCVLQ